MKNNHMLTNCRGIQVPEHCEFSSLDGRFNVLEGVILLVPLRDPLLILGYELISSRVSSLAELAAGQVARLKIEILDIGCAEFLTAARDDVHLRSAFEQAERDQILSNFRMKAGRS